jgi:integrase
MERRSSRNKKYKNMAIIKRSVTSSIDVIAADSCEPEKRKVLSKVEQVAGSQPGYVLRAISKLTQENADVLCNYILAEQAAFNISESTKESKITRLAWLALHCKNKPYKEMKAADIQSYLDSGRKSDDDDPLHKWIGYYNTKIKIFTKFFRWLYYHGQDVICSEERETPPPMQGIRFLKRKKVSNYRPEDLWTADDVSIFLKYCPNKRDRCYLAMASDTSCRPHELLRLRIKDIIFKQSASGLHQYAEVMVNGKTGQRTLPLFNSLPYIKEWLSEHPTQGNSNSFLFISRAHVSFGRPLSTHGLMEQFQKIYRRNYFPRLVLDDSDIPPEDKAHIKMLLTRHWNLYVQRHSALTEKAKILREPVLRQHAGWSPNSKMPQLYIHFFANESSQSLLEAYGIETRDDQEGQQQQKQHNRSSKLKLKHCPNCSEPNKMDAKFCMKCRIVLSYEAYGETIQKEKIKDEEIAEIRARLAALERANEVREVANANIQKLQEAPAAAIARSQDKKT